MTTPAAVFIPQKQQTRLSVHPEASDSFFRVVPQRDSAFDSNLPAVRVALVRQRYMLSSSSPFSDLMWKQLSLQLPRSKLASV